MLDRDDTPEVLRPAGEYVRAITTSAGTTSAAVRGMTLPCGPASSLDHALVGERDWIAMTFGNAVTTCLARVNHAIQETRDGTNAHDVADIFGSADIRKHQAI
ncbi:hypothetical protein [Nocardia cyriacigeorgica]|uniref:hypothetical protein n=1 Tax=Nocardia cyriacigeorgica TaxID=135487 RepID=UPI002458D7D2|nr:hypothetical protein [Nocardia cyriacigeorgica]